MGFIVLGYSHTKPVDEAHVSGLKYNVDEHHGTRIERNHGRRIK